MDYQPTAHHQHQHQHKHARGEEEGCGHGHGPGHGQGCGLSGLRRAPGVEPTDTGRWGPGAHSDSESGGRNMISKAMIAHADSKTPCAIQPSMAAVAKCADPSPGPEMSVAAGNWPAAFEWVPTRSRMTARSTQSLIWPMGRDRPRFRVPPSQVTLPVEGCLCICRGSWVPRALQDVSTNELAGL